MMQLKIHGASRLLAGFGVALLIATHADAQMPGRPGNTGDIVPHTGIGDEEISHPADPKPEQAAKKALSAGTKSLDRAKDFEAQAAAATGNPDKRGKLLEKSSDAYNKALDQFTEALANKSDLVEAWDGVGYVHLKLGAYREAVDDYNHALALKPDLSEAEAHRAMALLAIDHLEEARAAYMDLYVHSPALAEELMSAMQRWLEAHRVDPQGMRAKDVESFGQWVDERANIARQAAVARGTPSNP
jgi:tetratricopeptide (TPR) repeat protein